VGVWLAGLAVYHLLHALRVAFAVDGDRCGGGFDGLQVFRRQPDVGGAEVFFEPV
jgi:hypothetical protein